MRLLLFSGSQSPLATRHPRPKSTSALTLPPLVHRALHTALDPEAPSAVVSSGTLVIPQPGALARHALAQGETEFETTVRIQLCRADADRVVASVSEALAVLEQLKGLGSVDVVLLGLPEGVDREYEYCGSGVGAEWEWGLCAGNASCVLCFNLMIDVLFIISRSHGASSE
jgi:hypothetical protein